MRKRNF